jgi:hypothetical protein
VFRETDDWSTVPWRRVLNASSFTVPPFGAMKLIGRDTDRYLMKVDRPDAAGIDPRAVWFNGPYSIPPNFEGFGTPDPYPLAAYDDSSGSPSVGQIWRTQNGSWLLSSSGAGKPGFFIVAEPDTANKCVSVTRDAISPGVPPCGSPSDTVSFFGTNCTTNQQVRYDLTGYVDADGKWWGCVNPVPTGPAACCTTRATFAPANTARITMDAAGPTAVDNLDGSYTIGDSDTVYTDLTAVITGGTVGDSTHVAQVTFDAWGRVVGAASVAIAFPSSGVTSVSATSPIHSSGGSTPTIDFFTQTANTVLAGPSSGGGAAPGFRALVNGDLPTVDPAHGGTGIGVIGTISNGALLIGNGSGFSLSGLTSTARISITNSSGGITIGTVGYNGDLKDSTSTKIATIVDGVITSVVF